ncbi:hypothetical protein ACFP3Q_13070 [Nocardioides sp. GCM10027113]|uniref:hypothetical protein n=1 Tax=unclassified Nocardioides TaxID=2615069 RepID=UPI00361D7947
MLKVLFVIALMAAAVYLTVRLVERRGVLGPGSLQGRPQSRQRRQPRRTVAPDDDPEFLRDLDWENRRRRKKQPEPPEDPEGAPPA